MKKDISIKNIIISSIILLGIIIAIDIFFKPSEHINFDALHKLERKIMLSQNIAPQRLFVNAWRITKNSYIDKTLNNQDWMRWRQRYVNRIQTMDDANIAINSMLASLNDPYTKFLNPDSFKSYKQSLDSQTTGIGLILTTSDNKIVVKHVSDGSPAQYAGILPGDIIIEIDGQTVTSKDFSKFIHFIEDSTEFNIKLTIKRKEEVFVRELKKQDIPIKTMNYVITNDNIGIIVIYTIMGQNTINEFVEILEQTNNAKGIVIDLRDNFGGIFANAVQMASYMFDANEIVSIKSRVNEDYKIFSQNNKIFKDKPVVVLVNRYTASASEVFAGTLKENINAMLVGEKTYGKNSIQKVIYLQNNSGLIITTDKYILPGEKDINSVGLEPDVFIAQNPQLNFKKDKQLNEALKIINNIVKNKK